MTPTIGSLFSGAGMLDVAVQQAFGGDVVWHSENNAAASKVLAHHWPNVVNYGDITQIDWTTVEPVDIICGGWPCQPFSLAGKRKGVDDERALWPEVARAVRVVRPRLIILENVTAIFGPEFHRVANSLAALGYDMRWLCLRASAVGAPHNRERVFIAAHPADELCPSVSAGDDAETLGATRLGALVECEPQDSNQMLLPTPTSAESTGGGMHPDRREGQYRPAYRLRTTVREPVG